MNKQQVSAFTIMEMTVAMLISSIVIGIAYSVYTIVVGAYTNYNVKNNHMTIVIRLDELLKKDFSRADIIIKDQNSLTFKGVNGLINYQIEPGYITRTSSVTDTFKVSMQSIAATFEGQPVVERSEYEEQNRIDDMQLNMLFENENITYHYHKQYSAVNLFQRKVNAVN